MKKKLVKPTACPKRFVDCSKQGGYQDKCKQKCKGTKAKVKPTTKK